VPAAGLELRGVRKTDGSGVAVDDLEVPVRPGEVFGIVGRSGAGKTTTMRVSSAGYFAPLPIKAGIETKIAWRMGGHGAFHIGAKTSDATTP
jgi:ABC-type phosphonate transport system ATPase subunit